MGAFLCWPLPEYLCALPFFPSCLSLFLEARADRLPPLLRPGKRAFGLSLLLYHASVSTIIFQAPRFIPFSLGEAAESIRFIPETAWALIHVVLGLGFASWWQRESLVVKIGFDGCSGVDFVRQRTTSSWRRERGLTSFLSSCSHHWSSRCVCRCSERSKEVDGVSVEDVTWRKGFIAGRDLDVSSSLVVDASRSAPFSSESCFRSHSFCS